MPPDPHPFPSPHREPPAFVVFGRSPWGNMVYPWHQLAIRLARRHPVAFVRHPERMSPLHLGPSATKLGNGVVDVLPVDLPLQRFSALRRKNLKLTANAILSGLGEVTRPLVAVLYPNAHLDAAIALKANLLVYLVTDDYTKKQDGTEAPDEHFISWEKDAVAASDLVILQGEVLVKRFRAFGHSGVILLELPYDDELFDGTPHPLPTALGGLPRPLLGFAGTVRASRLDLHLIHEAARARPDLNFVFVGPIFEGEGHTFTALRKLPNIHFRECPSAANTPAFVQGFDVVIAPYRDQHANRGYYPAKIHDALAMGRAAVVTPFSELTELAPHVLFASDSASFLSAVDQALRAGNEKDTETERRTAVQHRALSRWMIAFESEVRTRLF